jgi:hypothetical protein
MEVQCLIKFSLKGKQFELTKEEAQDLVDALLKALGNTRIPSGPIYRGIYPRYDKGPTEWMTTPVTCSLEK